MIYIGIVREIQFITFPRRKKLGDVEKVLRDAEDRAHINRLRRSITEDFHFSGLGRTGGKSIINHIVVCQKHRLVYTLADDVSAEPTEKTRGSIVNRISRRLRVKMLPEKFVAGMVSGIVLVNHKRLPAGFAPASLPNLD